MYTTYELTILWPTDYNSPDKQKLDNIFTDEGVDTLAVHDEGIKNLAYPMQGHKQAYYMQYELKPKDAGAARRIEQRIYQELRAIRYLLVTRHVENLAAYGNTY